MNFPEYTPILKVEIPVSNEEGENAVSEERFNDLISDAPSLHGGNKEKAPFVDYKENTENLWKYVAHKEVYEYLKNRLFFNSNYEVQNTVKLFSIHREKWEEPITVPLDLVVGIAGFEDWAGRKEGHTKSWGSSYGSGSMESMSVIQHYAGLSTELPPVTAMQMYVQPDGKIFFDNGSGDSHRIAAAVLRGEKSIKTFRVSAYQLDKNYL